MSVVTAGSMDRLRPSVAACALFFAFSFAQLAAAAGAAAPDTLSRIGAAHRIVVAFSGDSPPFSSVGDGNAAVGYSIDICRKVVTSIGLGLGVPDLKVDWRVGTVAERLAMIEKGQADLDCANTSETLARLAHVDFSNRVFIDAGGLLVKGSSRIDRLADLANRKIGVIAGTTTEARLRATLKERLVNATVVTVREGPEGSAMLEAGSLDAFAGDKIKLVGLAAAASEPGSLRILPDDLSFEPYAFAIARGDSSMRLAVNRALSQLTTSGEIEDIFRRWLGQYGRPTGLLAAMYLLNTIPE
jgi:polar amino acid transport system substrate-binding protein/glutamate/aspartate transport system substrate-binding protein